MHEYLYTARQVYSMFRKYNIAGFLPDVGKSVRIPPGYIGDRELYISVSDKLDHNGGRLYSVQSYPTGTVMDERRNEMAESAETKPLKVYVDEMDDREIHMMGSVVAVVWDLKRTKIKHTIDGTLFTGVERTRTGDPYIDFLYVEERGDECEDGWIYVYEVRPTDGGVTLERAEKYVAELQMAIDYIKQINRNGETKDEAV